MVVERLVDSNFVALDEASDAVGIQLTEEHREELLSVDNILNLMEVPYVVLGSLGVAASSGSKWNPFKNSEKNELRDIDIFLITDEDSRIKAGSEMRGRFQLIETVDLFHRVLQFKQGKPFLLYRDVEVPMDRQLIQVFNLDMEGLQIPVLHPKTYLYLMTHVTPFESLQREVTSTLYIKMEQRIQELEKTAEENLLEFPEIEDKLFMESFGRFKSEIGLRHPVHFLKLKLRGLIYQWQREGRYEEVVDLRNYLREQHSWLVDFMRE